MRGFLLRLVLLLAAGGAWGTPASAQRLRVGSSLDDYVRLLQLTGVAPASPLLIRPVPLRPVLEGVDAAAAHPWASRYAFGAAPEQRGEVGLFRPTANVYWNSAHPAGQNDGAVWQGRGTTVHVSAGVFARYGILSATLRPSFNHAQNRDFELAPPRDPARSMFANPWHPLEGPNPAIDLPQQFGSNAFTEWDLGETSLRLDWKALSLGGSNESLWWGPGIQNAIIMSNNGPGVPHAFLGTGRPVNIGIGKLEANWLWGQLSESRYFDTDVSNDKRFMTGIVVDFEPAPIPGLYLGLSRMFMQDMPPGGLAASDFFLVFQGVTKSSQITPENPTGDDERDQYLSLFGRWLLPESGFEAYVEWARNDHSGQIRDFILEPDHSQAYTLGMQKAFVLSDGRYVRLQGELTHLEQSKTVILRATPTYYTHHIVRQGYTQRGQVIGAGIGPGSNSQFLGVDLFDSWGRLGGFFERRVYDNDAMFAIVQDSRNFSLHNVILTFGARSEWFLGPLTASAGMSYSRELNRYYEFENDLNNWRGQFSLQWSLPKLGPSVIP